MVTKRYRLSFLGLLVMIYVGGCQQLNINTDDPISPSSIGMEKKVPFGEEIRLELLQVIMKAEQSIQKGETGMGYSYWDPILAKQLTQNISDQHMLRSMDLQKPLQVQSVSIFDADQQTIRVSEMTQHRATLEMVLPKGEQEIGNRLKYVLERHDRIGWRIVDKQLLDNWER
jgi:hypothetical protein